MHSHPPATAAAELWFVMVLLYIIIYITYTRVTCRTADPIRDDLSAIGWDRTYAYGPHGHPITGTGAGRRARRPGPRNGCSCGARTQCRAPCCSTPPSLCRTGPRNRSCRRACRPRRPTVPRDSDGADSTWSRSGRTTLRRIRTVPSAARAWCRPTSPPPSGTPAGTCAAATVVRTAAAVPRPWTPTPWPRWTTTNDVGKVVARLRRRLRYRRWPRSSWRRSAARNSSRRWRATVCCSAAVDGTVTPLNAVADRRRGIAVATIACRTDRWTASRATTIPWAALGWSLRRPPAGWRPWPWPTGTATPRRPYQLSAARIWPPTRPVRRASECRRTPSCSSQFCNLRTKINTRWILIIRRKFKFENNINHQIFFDR